MKFASASIITLAALFVSSAAFAWDVPMYMCAVISTPTLGAGCTYTNQDGQTFQGVITRQDNSNYCTGRVVRAPEHSVLESLDQICDFEECVPASKAGPPKNLDPKATLVERDPTRPFDPDAPAHVKVCGDGWCHELSSYVDCNDYYSSEIDFPGVTCYDLI
jgi:hypothetical protein